jgi:hypothetical protein
MFAIGQGGKLGGFKFSAILLGVVLSVAGLLFISTLLYWSGNLLGGKGTFFEVLIAIIWSNVPLIVYIFLFYFPSLFLLSYIFRTLGNANNAENIFGTIQIFFIAINLYRFLLQIKYVGIAHKISFLRSVVSHLAGILLVIVFSLLGIFFLTISR